MAKIALAQINPTVGDLDLNRKMIIDFARKGESLGADIIVFPELAITGYPPEDLLLKRSFIEAAWKNLTEIARSIQNTWVVVGTPHREDGKLYNGAAVLHKGKIETIIHKTHLPNYGVFDERRYFTPAENVASVKMAGITTAVTICEDIWVNSGLPHDLCAREDIDLIINISSSPFHTGKSEERKNKVTGFASSHQKELAYCNLVGGQDELVFDGGSFFCDTKGKVTASLREFEEDLIVVKAGEENSGGASAFHSFPRSYAYPENVFEALKKGLKDYLSKNSFHDVVIALSGGIDSALTASIAVASLGAERVRGIAMPSRFSSPESLQDARELAENLGMKFDVIPITELMDSFGKALSGVFEGTKPGIAEENIQARIRGTLIMAVSNKFGSLALATGNKSEISVGYCTLYGDMAGGFALIKDLPKNMVYDLAKWINGNSPTPNIPARSIEKEPTAELRPNQKDSDFLPEYKILDPILKLYVEEEKSIEEIISLGYIEGDVRKVSRLVNQNEYKRRQAAPGVKISPKSFGKDRRMPITNRFFET
ncbi:MAG: NAD+ synthase [Nitrospinota bacterium]|nr:NAD+ synthase [Nitrospinota bacterium]